MGSSLNQIFVYWIIIFKKEVRIFQYKGSTINSISFPNIQTAVTRAMMTIGFPNIAGLAILGIGIFLSVDLYISQKYLGNFFVHLVLLFLYFLYVLTVLFFFPTFVHYEMKSLSYLKQSFFITFIRPLHSLLISVIVMMIVVIVYAFPFLIVFFAGPMLAYPIMWIGNKVFKSLESMEGK